jgi:hypothetical protein
MSWIYKPIIDWWLGLTIGWMMYLWLMGVLVFCGIAMLIAALSERSRENG